MLFDMFFLIFFFIRLFRAFLFTLFEYDEDDKRNKSYTRKRNQKFSFPIKTLNYLLKCRNFFKFRFALNAAAADKQTVRIYP